MDKKIIIAISIAVGTVVLAISCWFGFKISRNTKEAKAAVIEFSSLLHAGDLETLTLKYYAYNQMENKTLTDDNGQISMQYVTKQQMAERFGIELVQEEEESEKEKLLKIIMKYSQIRTSVGTVWGDTANMDLEMAIPDIKGWLNNLTEEDVIYLNSLTDGFHEDLEKRMASGEIAPQYTRVEVPMLKQNGKWRFQVTEEMEKVFFGGLYSLFEQQKDTEQ